MIEPSLSEQLRKLADQYETWSKNSATLFEVLRPEYERWEKARIVREDPSDPNSPIVPHDPPLNLYVIRTAIDNKLSSEKDLKTALMLNRAADELDERDTPVT
jgi:hypothetical protein